MNELTRKRAMSFGAVAVVAGLTTIAVLFISNKTPAGAVVKKVTG